jgi:hypothetical protein
MTSDTTQQLTCIADEASRGDRLDRFLAATLTGGEPLSRTRVKGADP